MRLQKFLGLQKVVILFIVLALLVPVGLVSAASNKVNLQSGATVSVNTASLHLDESTQTLFFELKYQNSGSKRINLLDYWVKVLSNSGNTYTVKVFPEDKNISSIMPKATQNVKYYAKVGTNVALKDLKVRVITFDFSVAGYERTLGNISLASFNNFTAANRSKLTQISGLPVYSKIKKYTSKAVVKTDPKDENKKETVNEQELQFVFFNNGRKAVSLPQYKFFFKTKSGLLYPLIANEEDLKSLSVNPKTYKELTLKVELPRSVSIAGAQLYLVQEMDTGTEKLDIAAGNYGLVLTPTAPPVQTNSKVVKYEVDNKKYEFTFKQMVRHYWDIQDVANFELNIANKGTTTAAIPKVVGTVSLDDGSAIDLTIIQNKNLTAISPGETLTVNAVARIPANKTYKKAKFTFAETVEKLKDGAIGSLTAQLAEKAPQTLNATQIYKTNIDSRQTTYQLGRTGLYENIYGNLYMAQLTITNDNINARDLSQVVAYFKTPRGLYYKANISDMKGAQNARSKRLVNVWATMPKSQSTDGLELIIGEGVLNGQFAVGGEVPDSMINTVTYKMPEEETVPQTSSGLKISPYTIKINELLAVFDQGNEMSNQMNLRLKYTMSKDYQYTNETEERKIVFSLEYEPGKSTFEQAVSIVQGENAMQLGDGTLNLTKSYDKSFNFHLFDQYSLYVYEEFQGHKKLIATKPIILYNTLDWSKE